MKKHYLLLCAMLGLASGQLLAETHVITIVGNSYSPSTVNAVVGDEVIISASGSHPLVQVDQATWDANGATPMAGGWGSVTADHSFTIISEEDIYFVCAFHVSIGMKGMINVSLPTGVNDVAQGTDLLIFPNPVTDGVINIRGDHATLEGSILELYSTAGQMVLSVPVQGQRARIGTSIATGIYTAIVLHDGEALLRQRFVVVTDGK